MNIPPHFGAVKVPLNRVKKFLTSDERTLQIPTLADDRHPLYVPVSYIRDEHAFIAPFHTSDDEVKGILEVVGVPDSEIEIIDD